MNRTPLHAVTALSGVLLIALMAACGAGPKGDALAELEALRASNYARQVRIDPEEVEHPRIREMRESAAAAVAESDQWYAAAFDAWESSKQEESEELARQGVLLYRAAEAYAHGADARQRIEQANAEYQLQLERRNRYNDMVNANEEVIMLLLALQELYDQTSDCRADVAAATAEAMARDAADHNVLDAQAAKRDAENDGANGWAEPVFNEGVRLLAEAQGYNDSGQYQLAAETALQAHTRFREAVLQSQTQIQDGRQRLLRGNGERLFQNAVTLFGENAIVDGRGVIILVPDLFPDRRSDISSDRNTLLDLIADFLRDNRRANVVIEGHTSNSGNADSNMAIARARAEAIRDYFLQHDIRSRRMSTEAYGEAYPRYDNRETSGRDDNNRVEIVFTLD